MRALFLLPLVLAGCQPDERYIVVTVEARPAVHDVAMIRVTLSNAGSMRTEDLPLGGTAFPATFSISPEDRTGDLGIDVEGFDEAGLPIAGGATQSSIDAAAVSVLLEPSDFVVNTDYAGDQQLSNTYGAHGLQLAASPDGTWVAAFNGPCTTPCNVFGRRFDASARPVSSIAAAGTAGFPLNTRLTSAISRSTVANNGTTTVAVWNSYNNPGYSVECRAIDASGAAPGAQVQIATDELPYIVSATALPNGNFALAWDGEVTNFVIRRAIVRPDCALVPGTLAEVSTNAAGQLPEWSHLATNGTGILYVWTLAGAARARVANLDGGFTTADIQLIAKTATEEVSFVRVAPLGAGFAVIVRWSLLTGTTGPGRLELYRVSAQGAVMGTPTLISDRSGSDFDSSQAFGVARRADGAILVVWHACKDKGDGSGCGVFGRLLGADGTPAGDEIVLATTTENDQIGPSAVALPGGAFATAWTDRSGAMPDVSGTAVRARIIYPDAPAGAGSN
jgi:hypothetical protein